MRTGVSISILLHVVMVVVAYLGLPNLRREVIMEAPIMVEIINVAETTNAPQEQVKAKEEKKAKVEEAKPEPPKPVAKAVPPPAPEPQQAPTPAPVPEEVAIVPPPPDAKPKAKEKPKPEPKPKPKPKPVVKEAPKPKAPDALVRAKPKRKPKPPDAFAGVLKTLKDLTKQPTAAAKPPEKKEEKKSTTPSFEEQIAKALGTKRRSFDQSRPLSISEIDLVRQQIAKCWNLPAGAKDAGNMVIEIAVAMNTDGTVRSANIKNTGLQSDPFLRAIAESA